MASSIQWKYDVFLSFRGYDTRRNFIDHLYHALHQKGVNVFKDDKELEKGKNISLDLLQVIRSSRFSIIVFSKNYAESSWCLDELVTIFDCVKKETQIALPVFYGMDPFDVRLQTGEYGKAFTKHTIDYVDNPDKVLKWKVAMTEVANKSGWDLQNGYEVEFIQDIVEGILLQLRNERIKFSEVKEGFIGIEEHLQNVKLHLQRSLDDVSIIGIWGMGGIGKTTIAKALYDKMSNKFEGRCFLENVREVEKKHGLVRLQEQLLCEILLERNLRIWGTHRGADEIRNRLCHKRLLVILDDVDNLEQLKSLAAKRDWFGIGSVIIITTRNQHLLSYYDLYLLYKVAELDNDKALQLLCLKAFKSYCPREGYKELSYKLVKYCKGLPLALNVIGCFLYGKSIAEWNDMLDRLKKIPNQDISEKLQISFNGLEDTEQQIFLDIACFFTGEDQDHVKRILRSCHFHPDIGIRVLIDKSLITINLDNKVRMHDLLQELGREIIRRQSPEELEKRSRLWQWADIYHVISNNMGTKHIEGIMMQDSYKEENEWLNMKVLSAKAFLKMKRLRLLKLQYVQISQGIEYLPSSLRFLDWNEYPFRSLHSFFHLSQLVELHMCNSKLKELWKGTKHLEMLRVINLHNSKELIMIPDFRNFPNLEYLNLEGCIKLIEVHESIGCLKELVSLNLKDCECLTTLPNTFCDVKSLKVLNLKGCSSLRALPERLGELTCLEILKFGGIDERKESLLAKAWEFLLPWKKPKSFVPLALPCSLSSLSSLTKLNMSYCHFKDGVILDDLSCFPLLKRLSLDGNDFVSLPTSLTQLSNLEILSLENCKNLQSIPECPSSIVHIYLNGCSSLESFPRVICQNRKQQKLRIFASSCFKLTEKQQNNNLILAWIGSFLLSSIKVQHNKQGLFFRISTSGYDIPKWFNYQKFDGNSLMLSPPPNWCNDEWIGFAICFIWESDPEIPCGLSYRYFELELMIDEVYDVDFSPSIGLNERLPNELHILFNNRFTLAKSYKLSVDGWNKVREIKLICKNRGLKVKKVGFRIMYKQDIEELIKYNTPPKGWTFSKNKRAHEDNGDGDGDGDEEEFNKGRGSCFSSSLQLEIPCKRSKPPTTD